MPVMPLVFTSPSWMVDAACAGAEFPDAWFPDTKADQPALRVAVAVCKDCPVKALCLGHALLHPTLQGVWGGWTEQEREADRRARRRNRAAL